MKRMGIIFLFSLSLFQAVSLHAQTSLKDIEGSWMGSIREAGTNVRLVFNFVLTDADTIKATLDSPDQSAKGIPIGRVALKSDTLKVHAPMIHGSYRGVLSGDSIFKGTWSQLGKDYPLDLSRQKTPVVVRHPQEPKPPFPYREEEVIFRNYTENFELSGTLSIPVGNGPFPAVVLITGSGSQDRNETLLGHKPFLVLSDYLARNGIVVLRYDDRGIGKSKGNMTQATSLSLAGDAGAALRYLITRPETDSSMVGLAGHSEGGLIASIVASREKDVAFVVSLAGTGIRGLELLMKQNRDIMTASGLSEKDINDRIHKLSKICEMVIADGDQRKLAKEAITWFNKELDEKGIVPEDRKTQMVEFTQMLVTVNNPWFRYFLATNPADFWIKVKCPVLALNGEKDLQVNYDQNLTAIKGALRKGGNKEIKIKSLPGLNHLFQHCVTCSPSEYASIEETFSPEAMKIVSEWILEKTVREKRK